MAYPPVYPEPRRVLQNPPTAVYLSNLFPFNHFRTLFRNGAITSPFSSITYALFSMQWRGGGVSSSAFTIHQSRITSHSISALFSSTSAHHLRDRNTFNTYTVNTLRTTFFATEGWGLFLCSTFQTFKRATFKRSLYFQQLTHCPICKPFVFITLQQWGGVGTPYCSARSMRGP